MLDLSSGWYQGRSRQAVLICRNVKLICIGLDEIGAHMTAADAVGNARDFGIGQRGLEKIEFAGAGVAIPHRDAEDGAVMLRNDEGTIIAAGEISEIPVFVQDFGDNTDPLGER